MERKYLATHHSHVYCAVTARQRKQATKVLFSLSNPAELTSNFPC
nr:MAG TPA: hypothetical protein [Caudoviricetes sp.]